MNTTNMNTSNDNMNTNDNTMNTTTTARIEKVDPFPAVDEPIDFNAVGEITAKNFRFRDLTWKDYAESVNRWLELKREDLNLIEKVIGVFSRGVVNDPMAEVNKILNESDALIKDDVQGIVDTATTRIQRKVEDKIGSYPQIEVMEYDKQYGCSVPTYYPDDYKVDEWEEKNRKEWAKLYPEWAYIIAQKLDGLLSTMHYHVV